ncbi:MAG: hypothetical protein F4Y39_23910 [Gemmatimonadetes bacterium]|nr:hypothetical protein [Gemmatimonadota bacterium]MYF75749.1 hypothetical protein [Gemmatimonadota bacterium]
MREARFEFQGSVYYMKKPYREHHNELLLIVDNTIIPSGKMKSCLIPIQEHYNIKSTGTSTHQRADAIFDHLEINSPGKGLKILPL